MTVAIFAQTKTKAHGNKAFRSRFEACIKLSSGEKDFPITRVDPLFEDLYPMVGTVPSASEWLALCLRRLAQAARQYDVMVRPLHVPMPMAILHEPEAPEKSRLAVLAEDCCPQEFILEFQDTTLAQPDETVLDRMEDFRRKGFRIGLDARRSNAAPFGARLRSAVERLRIREDELLFDETVQMRAEIVSSLGGQVILDRAQWKNVDLLMSYGATHALKLLADA